MVSTEMRKFGEPVVTLEEKEYRKLEGILKECLPNHVPIDIERVEDKIRLWARHPRVIVKALDKARRLLKEYGFGGMAVIAEERKGCNFEKIEESGKGFRTIRQRRKIGEKLIEEQFEEQKAKIKEQINELPKELRKAFVKELQESI